MKRIGFSLALLLVAATTPAIAERIVCASTTSTQNSGLFDYILPLFSGKTDIDVHVVAVGTGAAIEMGKRGDADVVFVHAKDLELQAIKEGYFVDRRDVMYNDFVIVGPVDAESEITRKKTASEALSEIAEDQYPFVSRGDNSGTHRKELSLWEKAGFTPKGTGWYLEVGQGMAKTLRIANEKRAFSLADRGTWLAIKDRELSGMKIVFEGDPNLFNQYGIMAVNPEKHRHVKIRQATAFIDWIVSGEGQAAIAEFRDEKGNQLFIPNAAQ